MTKRSKKQTAPVAPVETNIVQKDFANTFGTFDSPLGGFANLSSTIINNGYIASDTGTPVGPVSALQVSACYAAVRALSDDVAKLPLHMFQHLKPKGRERVEDHPIVDLLDEPNNWQTGEELIAYLVYSLVLEGNAYCFIQRDARGAPCALIPISPYQMQPLIDQNGTGEIFYRFTCTMFPTDLFACGSEDMIHIRSSVTSPNGVTGMSPIALGQQVLGNGVATQKSANVLFTNGAQLRGIITTNSPKLTAEVAQQFGEEWNQAYNSARNAGKTAILPSGTTFTPISQKADEAQLLDSRKFSVEEIARWFRIPTVIIGEMGRANFSNVQELNQSYIDYCLIGICNKLEEGFRRKLFLLRSDRKKYFFRFDFSEMLRANELVRMQANQIAINSGIKTQNEIRATEHLNPVAGGDKLLTPQQPSLAGKPGADSDLTQEPVQNPNAEDDNTDSQDE